MLLDASVVTRCRRRVHLEHDPAMVDEPQAPLDPGVEQRIADAAAHRQRIANRLGELLGADWTGIARVPEHLRAERTLEAMRAGYRFISGAQFPADPGTGRRGGVDLLVRSGDGYIPVLVVRHKITDPGRGARMSPLTNPVPEAAQVDQTRKVRPQPRDQLRLAHAVRMLQALGMSAGERTGGVIGVDGDAVLWHNLQIPSWPGGRNALEEYDARFADRLAVATAAATGGEPLAQPSRINACKSCPWRLTCEEQLRATRDVSLVVRGEDATALRSAGVSTVDDLARLSVAEAREALVSSSRAAEAVLLAKAWQAGVPLVRRVEEVRVPRADVEVDVDMESYADSGAYLWGCWLSGADIGQPHGYRAFVSWDPLPSDDEARSFAEFWTWFSAVRRRTRELGLTFRAYCYNELAENRWLLASAERFAGKPGIPTVEEIREFISSDEWVDLFALVRDQFLCPNGKGLKVIAPSAGFSWRDAEASGENSMRWYRDAVGFTGAPPVLSQRERLLQYNEDDVRATWTVRRWMTSDAVLQIPHASEL
ncbi:TM0106 family RecB-like putative nuclease [Saccharopolyspora rectivirgula]|uniref:Recombinase RecB n=1 Tax=Saccharopolyspora rectivirgula TaxID=28042 RepID=A0A073B100_9PSEU|nr:TM0106 family RecB-like putative nuclease [Saccharopolyspora rectivirgula]KEI45658.1 recombinase RecB [Saccharopolyspora rectivirgula]